MLVNAHFVVFGESYVTGVTGEGMARRARSERGKGAVVTGVTGISARAQTRIKGGRKGLGIDTN